MMRTTRIRCLLGWVIGCILLIGWMSVAGADHSAVDAEENLARYGLSPEEILNERLGFDGETLKLLIPTRPDGTPTYTWFDVTGDGCVDLCSGRMFGSGMVRLEVVVYDPISRDRYILDGYNYDYWLHGVSEGRLTVLQQGPNGYGDPVKEVLGTMILNDGVLLFVVDPEPVLAGSDIPFDPSLASVPYTEAVRIAATFAKEQQDAKYYEEVRGSLAGTSDDPESAQYSWIISFYSVGYQRYVVYVNAETGEVETSYTVSEGIG